MCSSPFLRTEFLRKREQKNSTEGNRLSAITDRQELLTVAEISANMKVPVSWVYDRTRRRGTERIPHYKLGKYLRFDPAEVKAWLSAMQRG